MIEVVKKVAITIVKSEAFKAGVTMAAAGAGTMLGLAAGAGIANTVSKIKNKIVNRKAKKGLDEEYSENTVPDEETEE